MTGNLPAIPADPTMEQIIDICGNYMRDSIPEAVDGDGAGMVADILNAESVDQLVGETEFPSAKDIAERYPNQMFRLEPNLVRRESTIESETDYKMPFYIIASLRSQNGETIRFNTSAATVLAKVLKLHQFNALPAVVSFSLADATKKGFRPVNMTVHSVTK